jgi:Glycosyltransferase sugar-binding region containing DXD motif
MMFSYWDRDDVGPIKEFIFDWRTHFPNFRVFGDAEVEPMIARHFPEYQDMFGRIRIPTCKSDLALLLVLYELGGLYVDCHCGVRDPDEIKYLSAKLVEYELILYDRDNSSRPDLRGKLFPLNSVLFARPRSKIILDCATQAFRNCVAQWEAEKENGFIGYNIWFLSGPGILHERLLDLSRTELRADCRGKVLFIPEGDSSAPIGRYMHCSYRVLGMHWSERQQREPLFSC